MRITPTKIEYKGTIDTKFGQMHKHCIHYTNIKADYLCKQKEQTVFEVGKEVEVNQTSRDYNGSTYYNVKPIKTQGTSNFSRQLKKEQSKYSGFAMSYAKDLVTSGMIDHGLMFDEAERMFKWMVTKDKELENGNT